MGSRPIARDDEDVSATLREVLEREGVVFRFGAECVAVSRDAAGARVGVTCEEGDPVVIGSHLLLAAMYAKLPYTVVARAVHIHSTMAELLPTTLQSLEPLDMD